MGDPYAETNAIARRELIDRLYRELAAKNIEAVSLRDGLRQQARELIAKDAEIERLRRAINDLMTQRSGPPTKAADAKEVI